MFIMTMTLLKWSKTYSENRARNTIWKAKRSFPLQVNRQQYLETFM